MTPSGLFSHPVSPSWRFGAAMIASAASWAAPQGGGPTLGCLLQGQGTLENGEQRMLPRSPPTWAQRTPSLSFWGWCELLLVQGSYITALGLQGTFAHYPLNAPCRSSIHPGHALLDIPHIEGVMYNKDFTYLNLFEVMWDFNLIEWYNNAFKLQCKYKLHLAEHSDCNIQLNHMNFTTNLYNRSALMTLGNPSQWEGVWKEY